MALNFNYVKDLADGNKIRIKDDPSPGFIELSVKIGVNAFTSVKMTSSEATELLPLINYLVRSREKDPA